MTYDNRQLVIINQAPSGTWGTFGAAKPLRGLPLIPGPFGNINNTERKKMFQNNVILVIKKVYL
jgi:hypothetical protein